MSKELKAFYTIAPNVVDGMSFYYELTTIEEALVRLEKLEKIFSDLKSMFEIKIGIDTGNEYFMEIKQLDDRIAELIPREDIEIFKEVLDNEM